MTKPEQAAADLATYLHLAGINSPSDQVAALRRHYGVTLLDMLQRSNLAIGLGAMDMSAGAEILIARLSEPQP